MRQRLGTGVGLIVVWTVLDLITKRWASTSFSDEPEVIVPGLLTFTFGENPGSSFSMFQNAGPVLAVIAAAAVLYIVAVLARPGHPLETVGLGLIGGGAAGNLADRLFRADAFADGAVIDWIQFPNFPVFNLADTGITVGVGLLFIAAWIERKRDGEAEDVGMAPVVDDG